MNIKKLSEIPTTSGIYRFTNISNNKIYIGSAKNLRKRFGKHLSNLRLNKHHSKHFQNAWNKYGENSFEYDIIEFVEDVSNLLIREQYYLDTLLFAQEYIKKESNKFLELGYNINPCASNRLGTVQSKEAIQKMITSKSIPVLQFDFSGNFISEYISIGEAAKFTQINRSCIFSCCKHQQEYAGNFFFIYKKDLEQFNDYFESLKESPFVPQVWNKGLKGIRPKKDDCLIVFDRYGRYINTFAYQTDVAKFIKSTTANLSKAKNEKIIKNYLVFDLDFDYQTKIEKIRNEYSFIATLNPVFDKIMMYDNFENFITGFENVHEASEITGLKEGSIYDVLCNRRKQIKGFIFKYYDEIV